MIVLTAPTEQRIRADVSKPGLAADIFAAVKRRADRCTATPGFEAAGDLGGPMAWWHVAWERLADAAFVQRLEPTEERADWIRAQVLGICNEPIDDWLGPFFRERSDPPSGTLETSHVVLGVITAFSLCGDLFTGAEHALAREVVRTHGMLLCHRGMERMAGHALNNWYMVLLNGYGTAAVFLDDRPAIKETVERFATAATVYEDDSYGESLQYWNYASNHLAHLYEVLVERDPAMAEQLDISCYTRCIPWVVHSFMYMRPLDGWGDGSYPRSLNFGDSAAVFRPSADLLLHIATRARETHPVEAGLARWLFDTTYADPDLEPVGGDTFGFFNDMRWSVLARLPDAPAAISPNRADLDLTGAFACGTVAVRDQWDDPTTVLGMQAGHLSLRTANHRHADQNSFILAHRGERFLADPGHCCYRLPAQQVSIASRSHSTWTFELPAQGEQIGQHQPPAESDLSGRRLLCSDDGGITVVRADAAVAYPGPIERAERTWVAALPDVVFVIDVIGASEPVRVHSHFVLNNRDNALHTSGGADAGLRFQRGAAALKLVRLMATSGNERNAGELVRGWTYMHDVYHPEPNRPGQSREGAGEIYTFTTRNPAESHLALYAIALDTTARIDSWRMSSAAGGGFDIECDGELRWHLDHVRDTTFVFADLKGGVQHTIEAGSTSSPKREVI